MIIFLRILFSFIFVTMVFATIDTSMKRSLFVDLPRLLEEPWVVMTLFDAYFGFLTFYIWVFYKESSVVGKTVWFFLIMLLGNIVMSIYVLIQLFKIKSNEDVAKVLLR